MNIPSTRTRHDMEIAADLRAQGGTWATIALQLKRQPGLLMRWTRLYAQEWERLLNEAEERLSRHANSESRAVLRELLRSGEPRVRLAAAERLAKLRLQEKAKETPPDPHADVAAFVAAAEAMSDAELEEYLGEFLRKKLTTENTESTERIQN
jgi:HEAT repeat protein